MWGGKLPRLCAGRTLGRPCPPSGSGTLGDKKDVTRRPVVAPLDSVPPGCTPLVPAERGAPGRPS
ncbi:unnamed protein product [Lepidochelys olivacea]